tara:strand:- start:1425 stop:1631 length:207 start_codon:yes stop_codon:yes gene_type:complete
MDTITEEATWQDCLLNPPKNDDVIVVSTDHSSLPMFAMYDNKNEIYTSPQGYQIVWPNRWVAIPKDDR